MKKVFLIIFTFVLSFASNNALKPVILENGFKYYFDKPLQNSDFIFFELKIDFGSIHEKNDEQGLAHFIEHMAFNGTNKYKKDDFLEILKNAGVLIGRNLNATTDFDNTSFKLQILNTDENLNLGLDILKNILSNLAFYEDEVEKEKGIILNEALERNDAKYQIFKDRLKIYYNDSLFTKRVPIGDLEIVKSANSSKLKSIYKKHYLPCNATLIVLGNLDKKLLNDKINYFFGNLKNEKCEKNLEKINFFDKKVNFITLADEINFYFEDKKESLSDEKYFENNINSLLLSKILNEIYYKNSLNNEIRFSILNIQNQKIFYNFKINSGDKKDLNEFISVLKMLKNGINESYFLNAKKELLKDIFINYSKFPTPLTQMQEMVESINLKQPKLNYKDEFNLYLKLANNLNIDSFNSYLKRIFGKKGVIFEAPFDVNLKKVIQNEEPFLPSYKKIKNLEFDILEPNENITYTFDKKLKLFKINANNKRVIFMSFPSPYVNIFAIKKGGLSAKKDKALIKAAFDISNFSGVGKYSKKDLDDFFKSEVNFNKSISDLSSIYSLKSDKNSIEYAFKILHSDFLYPKIDKNEALNYFKFNDDNKDPKLDFEIKLNEIYYGLKEERLKFAKSMDLQNELKLEFEDANNFTFFIIGDIKFADLIKYVKNYISNLPNKNNNANFIDDKVRAFQGEHIFIDKNNPFIKDEVYIFLNSDKYEFSVKNSYIFEATSKILQSLINEEIRENRSQTYGIKLSSSFLKYPYIHSFAQITFTTFLKNGKNVSSSIKEIIQHYSLNLIDEKYLVNYKKVATINLKTMYKNPEIILNFLINYFIYDEKYLTLEEKIEIINSITLEEIKECIRINFNNGNYFGAIFTHN